jgi:myosin heavy subunit
MQIAKKMMTALVLASCVAVQAQNSGTMQQANTKNASSAKTKAKPKSQEQILLEELNEKFKELDQLSQEFDDLQRRFDVLEKQTAAHEAELKETQQAVAPDTKEKVEAASKAVAQQGSNMTALQSDVDALKTNSSVLTAKVETVQQETKKLESPDTIHFKGIDLTPGGFIAAETVDRQRGIGADVNTQFSGIPFSGQTAGVLSEFNASGRQSRRRCAGITRPTSSQPERPRMTIRATAIRCVCVRHGCRHS